MQRNELIGLLEVSKRSYCRAIKRNDTAIMEIQLWAMEEIRTSLYTLNVSKGIEMNNELYRP